MRGDREHGGALPFAPTVQHGSRRPRWRSCRPGATRLAAAHRSPCVTKLEAMLKQPANKGVSGDLRAIREVLKLPVETGNGEDAGGWRPVVSGEPLSDAEWERRYGRSEADVAARREEALAAIDAAFAEYKAR